jgi:hypothetical protein
MASKILTRAQPALHGGENVTQPIQSKDAPPIVEVLAETILRVTDVDSPGLSLLTPDVPTCTISI